MSSKARSDGNCRKFGLNSFKENWFSEKGTLVGDHAWSIELKDVIHREKSNYQDILIFDSSKFGRCLALDIAIQCTEKDEFAYNEMITFLPLLSHPQPRKVLIIGGGDGGVVRQVIKHPSVQSVVLCEIDEAVIRICQRHLPSMAKVFQSPKLTVNIGDGVEYARNQNGQFDVIVSDSRDLVGPASRLSGRAYFESLKAALRPRGVIAVQAKCVWFDTSITKELLDTCRTMFPVVSYASTFAPSFPGGQCGILLCGISADTNFREPIHKFTSQTLKDLGLRYYTPDVHRAAFAYPIFFSKELGLKEDVHLF